MKLHDINLSILDEFPRKPGKPSLYKANGYYYKMWDDYAHRAYYVIDGFDLKCLGFDSISYAKIGLLTPNTCSAFHEFIYDDDNVCRGYITKEGVSVDNLAYDNFIDLLVETSVLTGYGYADVKIENVVSIDGKPSFIDFDNPPVKLSSIFSIPSYTKERYNKVFSCPDLKYLKKLYERIGYDFKFDNQ